MGEQIWWTAEVKADDLEGTLKQTRFGTYESIKAKIDSQDDLTFIRAYPELNEKVIARAKIAREIIQDLFRDQ